MRFPRERGDVFVFPRDSHARAITAGDLGNTEWEIEKKITGSSHAERVTTGSDCRSIIAALLILTPNNYDVMSNDLD